MIYISAIERVEYLQERERQALAELESIKEDKGDIFGEYFIEKCGDKYEEIYDILTEIKEYVCEESDKCVTKQEQEMRNLVTKSLQNLISKKKRTNVQYKAKHIYTWGGDKKVVLGTYGFGIESYGRAQSIDYLEDIIGILNTGHKFSKYVWKQSKKQILDTYQEHLIHWKFIDNQKINKDTTISKKVEYVSDEFITMFSKLDDKDLDCNIVSYGNSLKLGRSYSDNVKVVNFNKDITPYNCFLIFQMWDDVKDILYNARDILKDIYEHNKSLQEKIIEKVGHLIVAEGL